jgi:uncharacterized integral membrane protein
MSEPTIHAPATVPGTDAPLDHAPAAPQPPLAAPPPRAPSADGAPETRGARFFRMAHRTRLHLYALATVVLVVYVVALATSNTRRVKVDWVFSSSAVPLVWLMLFAAILGWLIGILITVLFRLRTRAPHPPVAEPTSAAPVSPAA